MKKYFVVLLSVLLLALPSFTFASENMSNDTIQPLAVTVNWQKNNIATSTTTDGFYIGSSRSSLKLTAIQQSTTSIWTSAKIEYRLLKQNSSGSFVDTGIYDVLEGSFNPANRTSTTLYGTISPGTYKIKITNKNGSSVKVHSIGKCDL
ncbi:hypothetical protein [Fredinandcohnia quinoae]|uniref:Uncharacterized protein n=1 Tax=Fredinandcohnia quinoae TaxID=2918902 RepID=A0AAW5DX52_9BACI|nr:hypothetical protein [Fredinandcohnia sp. SECRCQ15]MCH1625232.1 hypothetical protein [Fredinandcohnia sp. SECRCQ15]